MLLYYTGKGTDHLVPILFPEESHMAMKYLAVIEVKIFFGNNEYIFASTIKKKKKRQWCLNILTTPKALAKVYTKLQLGQCC